VALIAALVLAAAGASAWPLAEPFWSRDLGALQRALAEAAEARVTPRGAALFAEASALLRCEPLPPLAKEGPDLELRALLRLEEARRHRLGAAASSAPTLWRDVLAHGFFRLAVGDPRGDDDLAWPGEVETWPEEVLLVAPIASGCASPPAARGASASDLPPAALVSALRALRLDETAARIAYHRAVLLAREGHPDASAAARDVVPEKLAAPLRPFAALLRLEAGADDPEGYLALVGVRELGPATLAVLVRAADLLAGRGATADALAMAERGADASCKDADAPIVRALRFHRASALAELGRTDEAGEALRAVFACRVDGPDPQLPALRDLAVALVAGRPLDAELRALLDALAPSRTTAGDVLWAYGRRALAARNDAGALTAADALAATRRPDARLRAHALRAEAAFAAGDTTSFERHVGALLDAASSPRQRVERDRLAIELASSAAVRLGGGAGDATLARALETALDRMAIVVALGRAGELARVREAARNAARTELALPAKKGGAVALALGAVPVATRSERPPVPDVRIAWPEPWSLIALPRPDGMLAAAFELERDDP
jgi:hypothetical protein